MNPILISPTWSRAQELAAVCLGSQGRPVPGFYPRKGTRELAFLKGEGSDLTHGILRVDLADNPNPKFEYLVSGATLRTGMSVWKLFPGVITFEERLPEGVYPKFAFTWQLDSNVSGKGNLFFVRVDLAGDTHVNYLHARHRTGQPQLLKQLPMTLDGETDVAGFPIPFVIDFEEVAQRILKMVGLEEFAEACRKAARN